MPEVIRIIKNKSEGETVRNSDYGTLNQIALRIFLKAENKNELKKLIRKIRACVKIYSPLGDDVRVTKTKWKDKIFSVKDKNIHKVITILGVKLKFKSKNLILEHQINCLENENKFLSEKIDETQKKYEELNKKMSEWLTANFRYTEHTNKILNRIIEKFDDEELKIEQIKYLFKGVHKNEYDINIAEPKTFNEKIHWLSLNQYSNNPLIAKIVDKLTFKDYIKETLGEGYTIPLLGSWDNPCEIDYEKLPQKFVLKSNWGGDGKQVLIVKDKSLLNKTEANDKMREWLSFSGNSYYYAFNGPVQTITPCILAEEYIETSANMLNDYKFMCFNGEPLWILACSDRGDNTKYENHDMNWNLFVPSSKSAKIPKIEPPKNFDKMVELAKTLSKPFPFVRVDFYEVDDRVYVGEMTFTPKGGFNHYYKKWDLKFGEKLDISYLMKGKENV